MTTVRTAHTGELEEPVLRAARTLLDEVFDGRLTDEDWDHTLGGIHALIWDGGSLIGHAALIQRRILHDGRALRTGYVEGVGVRADHRGRGHGAALMHTLEGVLRGAYELGALAAADGADGFYQGRGWTRWPGRTSALTPAGIVPTPEDDGYIHVLPLAAPLNPAQYLTCDWRPGDVW